MPRLLDVLAVEQVARNWAIERNLRPAEPALLVFCPVKCESYFTDNGRLPEQLGRAVETLPRSLRTGDDGRQE